MSRLNTRASLLAEERKLAQCQVNAVACESCYKSAVHLFSNTVALKNTLTLIRSQVYIWINHKGQQVILGS